VGERMALVRRGMGAFIAALLLVCLGEIVVAVLGRISMATGHQPGTLLARAYLLAQVGTLAVTGCWLARARPGRATRPLFVVTAVLAGLGAAVVVAAPAVGSAVAYGVVVPFAIGLIGLGMGLDPAEDVGSTARRWWRAGVALLGATLVTALVALAAGFGRETRSATFAHSSGVTVRSVGPSSTSTSPAATVLAILALVVAVAAFVVILTAAILTYRWSRIVGAGRIESGSGLPAPD
jgi:hypothetical protein